MLSGSRFRVPSFLCLSAALAVTLTGCSAGLRPAELSTTPAGTPLGTLTGHTYGGSNPLLGAHVFLFAASTTGYGGKGIAASTANASTSLLTAQTGTMLDSTMGSPTNGDYYVTTDINGRFSITGDYTCTPGTQVYMYASGGDSGSGNNTAVALMAVLGNCPAGTNSTFASTISFVDMNELSTVAAAYALAGFATDPLHIGTSGSTLGALGIKNAAANAAQMYQLDGNGGGGVYGSTANAATPGTGTRGGTGTVPQAEINTLGNILAACVQSTGASSPGCSKLFPLTTNAGTAPTDTATAAINLAHNPAQNSANTTAIYNVEPATGNPYYPVLSAAPNDWTVQLTFNGLYLQSTNEGGGPLTHSLAIDGNGNVWIANVNTNGSGHNGQLEAFSPLGVPLVSGSYAINAYYSGIVAIDAASANVWVTSKTGSGGLIFNIATATSRSYTTTGSSTPSIIDTEFDGSGNVWIADNKNNALIELNSSGTQVGTFTGNSLNNPISVALEPGTAGNVWVSNFGGPLMSGFTNAGAAYTTATTTHGGGYNAAAVDANGYIWTTDDYGGTYKTPPTGGAATYFAIGSGSDGLGIDGAGNIWVADRDNARVCEANNAGTLLTTTTGIAIPTYNGNANYPNSLAVDGSGNVWFDSFNSPTVSELIGAAAPVATPTAYAVANSLLGTRP